MAGVGSEELCGLRSFNLRAEPNLYYFLSLIIYSKYNYVCTSSIADRIFNNYKLLFKQIVTPNYRIKA